MLRDVSIQQGGFSRYKSHCNMQLYAQADDSSNMHRESKPPFCSVSSMFWIRHYSLFSLRRVDFRLT